MYHAEFCSRFVPPGGSVLDVGMGKGRFVVAMAERGFVISGIEINPEYIKTAQEYAQKQGVSAVMKEGNAEVLPFKNATFDFANCSEVTEHADKPSAVISEMYRVLKPGGFAYVSFHNRFGAYDYHYHTWFINWLPRPVAGKILSFFGKNKLDGEAGRQQLSTMHYFRFKQAAALCARVGFLVNDIREEKISKKFGFVSPVVLFLYRICIRPLYFNTFHLLLQKPPL